MSRHPQSSSDPVQPSPGNTNDGDVTQLLVDARDGSPEALNALVERVYRELHSSAAGMVRRQGRDLTLVTADLVHEAFLRLFDQKSVDWENRRHFFGSAAIAMRRVLIDHARRNNAGKRIPKDEMIPIEGKEDVAQTPDLNLLALDHALEELAQTNPRQAKIVELRFFAGLTESEVSDILGISTVTVSRDWKVARLKLKRAMRP